MNNIFTYLIENGSNINIVGVNGYTPLYLHMIMPYLYLL
jgi:ankyrin repeat protein